MQTYLHPLVDSLMISHHCLNGISRSCCKLVVPTLLAVMKVLRYSLQYLGMRCSQGSRDVHQRLHVLRHWAKQRRTCEVLGRAKSHGIP